MSTRRKKYSRQAKTRAERYGTSESDTPVQDTEHQQTMRIITRLSQKYLTTRATPGSTSHSCASTDTEEEYYGDEENSQDTGGHSDASITSPRPHDAYDFDSTDNVSNPGLFLLKVNSGHLRVSHKQTKPNKKPHSHPKKQEVFKKQQHPKISTKTIENVPKSRMTRISSNQMSTIVPGNSSIRETPSQRQNLRKRKSNNASDTALSTPADTSLGIRRSSPRIKDINESKSSSSDMKRDSGVFISPPLRKRVKLGSNQTTSTPSSESRAQKIGLQALEDSHCGFDTLDSPALGVSPVKPAITPMSDYCSMSSSHFTSMDVSTSEKPVNQGFPFVLQEEHPKVTSKSHKPKRPRKVSEKEVQWAEKMNKEFAELENFELSIEG